MVGARVGLVVAVSMALAGCEHAMVGNTVALGMTLCLFFGTLQLGRRPGATNTATDGPGAPRQSETLKPIAPPAPPV